MLPEFRWEKSLANIRLHIFVFYLRETEIAFRGLGTCRETDEKYHQFNIDLSVNFSRASDAAFARATLSIPAPSVDIPTDS